VDLRQPPSTTPVIVNGTSGNTCMLILSSPYGYVPAIDGTPLTGSSITVRVTNPSNNQGYWGQGSSLSDYPALGYKTDRVSTSGLAAITSPVTLPSLASVTGANCYGFQLTGYGQIDSSSAAVSLPSWMKSLLSGKSIAVSVQANYTSLSFDLSLVGNLTGISGHILFPNFQFVLVNPSTGPQTINFP